MSKKTGLWVDPLPEAWVSREHGVKRVIVQCRSNPGIWFVALRPFYELIGELS